MIQYSPDALANSIRMRRPFNSNCFLIVEGRDDVRFFKMFLDQGKCQIEVAGGKDNVIKVLSKLENGSVPGVVGVVDGNFDHIEGIRPTIKNLIVLETVDL